MNNNNPTGINGYKDRPSKNDPKVANLLREYHRNGQTNRDDVSNLLFTQHKIKMSPATVARRFKDLGLVCSKLAMQKLTNEEVRQLILDEMAEDPSRRKGPAAIKEGIAFKKGIHLPRDFVRDEMRLQDPEGFSLHEPTARKVVRGILRSLGPNHEWSADGHDKLTSLGFAIWGIRDKWSGKWLALWVLPNNRYKHAIAFLYLKLVAKLGGMPIQSTTDCGSETTLLYGLATSLREASAPELDEVGMGPAHVFVKSIYNITIERGWLQLRLKWVDNVKIFFEAGREIYNPNIPHQYELVQWLWPKLLQQELDVFRHQQNYHKIKNNHMKLNPSGVAPSVAYSLFEKHNGQQCLQPVDAQAVQDMMAQLGGEALVQFVTPEYALRCQEIYDSLGVATLTFQNVWQVYLQMLPSVSD